jgi:hypothetical protein
MTQKALILSYVKQANTALRYGDCLYARDAISRAVGLQRNSPVRLSASLIRTVMKAHATIGRKCGVLAPSGTTRQQTPEGLVPPSYVPGMQPAYGPDTLMPPSFRGPADQAVSAWYNALPAIGFAFGALGLILGFGTLYKR